MDIDRLRELKEQRLKLTEESKTCSNKFVENMEIIKRSMLHDLKYDIKQITDDMLDTYLEQLIVKDYNSKTYTIEILLNVFNVKINKNSQKINYTLYAYDGYLRCRKEETLTILPKHNQMYDIITNTNVKLYCEDDFVFTDTYTIKIGLSEVEYKDLCFALETRLTNYGVKVIDSSIEYTSDSKNSIIRITIENPVYDL